LGQRRKKCFINVHDGEFHNMYSSPNIRMIELGRMRWLRHMTSVGKEGKLVGKSEWVYDNIKLELNEDGRVWTGFTPGPWTPG
jgi:hypothetical protein